MHRWVQFLYYTLSVIKSTRNAPLYHILYSSSCWQCQNFPELCLYNTPAIHTSIYPSIPARHPSIRWRFSALIESLAVCTDTAWNRVCALYDSYNSSMKERERERERSQYPLEKFRPSQPVSRAVQAVCSACASWLMYVHARRRTRVYVCTVMCVVVVAAAAAVHSVHV